MSSKEYLPWSSSHIVRKHWESLKAGDIVYAYGIPEEDHLTCFNNECTFKIVSKKHSAIGVFCLVIQTVDPNEPDDHRKYTVHVMQVVKVPRSHPQYEEMVKGYTNETD